MTRAYKKILVERENGIERVTLNYPERRNAIGPTMTNELLWAFADAHDADEVRAIVLTGSGKAFCAGGDFAEMAGGATGERLPHKGDYSDLLLAMVRADKPIIARVNGLAMGGGLGMVAASHFAVAADDAVLGTPEIDVGLFPMMIMAVLARYVPRRRLLQMMLLGEKFSSGVGRELGLVSQVVVPSELDAAVKALADGLLSKSPMTIRLGLRAFGAQDDLDLESALPLLRDRLAECLSTDDAREGLTAFLEKRKPMWTGK